MPVSTVPRSTTARSPLFWIVLASLAGGCGPTWLRTDTGIPNALGGEGVLKKAGALQGISVLSGGGASTTAESSGVDHEFEVTIASGTRTQLLAALRTEVNSQIVGCGATICGTGQSGSGDDNLTALSYDYRSGRNRGIVRVHSFVGTNGKIRIVLIAYEHGA
ncbi:MAG TPA: hypothetical protein VEI07_25170 [Planctomycetaceae bacterium]|nr:hypothetical protein [Planctomycetaceae bacterium]